MKRVFILLVILLCIAGPVCAGGASEVLGGMAEGAARGAASMARSGPMALFGAIVGGIIGAVVSGSAKKKQREAQEKEYALQKEKTYQDQYINAKSNFDNLYKQKDDLETKMRESKTNLENYDEAINRWGEQYDQGLQNQWDEGKSAYTQAMSNFGAQSNYNAQTGQSGGTADLVAGQQRQAVTDLVGDDLKLDRNGGKFGQSLANYDQQMNDNFDTLVGQRELEIEAYNKNLKNVNEFNKNLEESSNEAKKAAEDYNKNRVQGELKSVSDYEGITPLDEYSQSQDTLDEIERLKKKLGRK